MVVIGCEWLQEVASCCKWSHDHVVVSGCEWLLLVVGVCKWLRVVEIDCDWLQVIAIDCERLHAVASGTLSGYKWLWLIANLWQPVCW